MRQSRTRLLFLAATLVALASRAPAQPAPERGPREVDPRWHALVGATVVPAPGERLEDATIVMRDGVIVAVGRDVRAPAGARVRDLTGFTVYPGLVEAHLPVDAPAPDADAAGIHPHAGRVMPQRSALDGPGPDADTREALRSLGFTAAAISPRGGNLRGTAAVVTLADPDPDSEGTPANVLSHRAYQEVSLERARFGGPRSGRARRSSYPNSQMGAIALVRQTLSDADWYHECLEVYLRAPLRHEPPDPSDALDALGPGGPGSTPLWLDASDELELLRGAKIAAEFQRPMVLLGSGTEFRRLRAVADTGLPIVVPLRFPDAPDVSTPALAAGVSLRELMTWDRAPENPARLVAAGVEVCLTSDHLGDRAGFRKNLARAIEHGLDEDAALAMLTTRPARLLGVEARVGRIAPGRLACLVAVEGSLFDPEDAIREVWVDGRRYEVERPEEEAPKGTYLATLDELGEVAFVLGRRARERPADPEDEGEAEDDAPGEEPGEAAGRSAGARSSGGERSRAGARSKTPRIVVRHGDAQASARKVVVKDRRLSFLFDGDDLGARGVFSVSALVHDGSLYGSCLVPSGATVSFVAERDHAGEAPAEDGEAIARDAQSGDGEAPGKDDADPALDPLPVPLGAYGLFELPEREDVYLTGGTVWTSGPAGILEDGVLVVRDGKVAYAGPREGAPDPAELEAQGRPVRVIDVTGKHVTPGILDCHSHTGIDGGVNETGERVTAEVRIEDVIDPDDINWYRQLAGGVTAVNQLHGSANAIGGQNCVVKLRFGVGHPDAMRLDGAPSGIKFALGENPKRVAQNTEIPDEYPQTRMGVAALIRDRLEAGLDYRREWERYLALAPTERRVVYPPRRDLELEALGEIRYGERLIHCHSYRQDEIFMLAKLAGELGFRIGTFQHVLEGYKVAEAVRDHSRGGSTFSDWWAYKFEVIDAIPHNAALMTEVGAVVSVNSDSNEHARRLNTEAGKSMKYGGLSPAQALALVTINPAYQLGIERRVGSLEEGKDADFAVWSGDPLSYRSRCEQTWIDGRPFFTLERDRELRAQAAKERGRLLQRALREGEKPGGRRPPRRPTPAELEREALERELLRAGLDPTGSRPGECGCHERLELEAYR